MAQHALAPATTVVTAGRGAPAPGDALNVPITLASNYASAPDHVGPEYARSDGTPTWAALEEAVGTLEGGTAIAYASGMAAISAILGSLEPGAVIAAPDDVYHGAATILEEGATRFGWVLRRVPVADTDRWLDALPGADLVWLESPSNPLLEVTDLATVIPAAAAGGATTVVDNTFATPLRQQPLALGADLVVHSATKFIGGHSDLLCGIAVARDPDVATALRRERTVRGATPGALEAFLALRGLRTMHVRLERAEANARRLVRFLAGHPAVADVRYPVGADGVGFGAIISFGVGETAADADLALGHLHVIHPATSLGGVESTVERRASLAGQEHVPVNLLRLSVGIEDGGDLEADLRRALDAVAERT